MSIELQLGAEVTLTGLVGAPEKNGARGILGNFTEETGRWKVELQGGDSINAKTVNIALVLQTDKEAASYKPLAKAPSTTKLGSYYGTDPDDYKKARVVRDGDVKSRNFDHQLYVAISKSLNDAGTVTLEDFKSKIWPEVADGSRGKSELTCNERWTVRYGLAEFNWQFEARVKLMQDMPTIDVLGVDGKKVTDKTEINELLHGPSLAELVEPPAKKRKGDNTALIWVDGMYLAKDMLKAVSEATGDDGVVDCFEAVNLFNAATKGDVLTCCERWTLRFILSAYTFTDAAFMFIKEALAEHKGKVGKLTYTDSLDC